MVFFRTSRDLRAAAASPIGWRGALADIPAGALGRK
jgi:hypothetical protein